MLKNHSFMGFVRLCFAHACADKIILNYSTALYGQNKAFESCYENEKSSACGDFKQLWSLICFKYNSFMDFGLPIECLLRLPVEVADVRNENQQSEWTWKNINGRKKKIKTNKFLRDLWMHFTIEHKMFNFSFVCR